MGGRNIPYGVSGYVISCLIFALLIINSILCPFAVSVTIAKLRKSYVVWLQTGGGEIRILEPDMGIRVEHERLDE